VLYQLSQSTATLIIPRFRASCQVVRYNPQGKRTNGIPTASQELTFEKT
jgi:hypothetical protein